MTSRQPPAHPAEVSTGSTRGARLPAHPAEVSTGSTGGARLPAHPPEVSTGSTGAHHHGCERNATTAHRACRDDRSISSQPTWGVSTGSTGGARLPAHPAEVSTGSTGGARLPAHPAEVST